LFKKRLDSYWRIAYRSDMETHRTGREQLAQWIERSKLTQVETARRIGIDPTQLSQILTGKRRPGLDNAVRIERATGIVVEAWVPFGDDESADSVGANSRNRAISKA
jgi:transcriptional regulator with XRE-family HTH domain